MQFTTYVEADVPRVECPEHGVLLLQVPWAEDSARYTTAFESMVIDWADVASISSVATNLQMSWDAVKGIMNRAVARGEARREFTPPTHLSVDETSFQRRHEYVTVVTDQVTGAVLYVADDRTKETLAGYFEQLSADTLAGIQSVSMDMWPAYISVVQRYVPGADTKICFDKFHLSKYLGDAVDKVRREENKALTADGDERLKKTRYMWLYHPRNMTNEAWRSFEELRTSALNTAEAWAFKETAMSLWYYVSRTWALKQWSALIDWALASPLQPVRKVATIIQKHLWGIVNAILLKRTNARAESANSVIQRIKSRACGFRNRESFRTAIMFHLGKLDLYPRHTEFS